MREPPEALGHQRERWGGVDFECSSWPCSRAALRAAEVHRLVRGCRGAIVRWASVGKGGKEDEEAVVGGTGDGDQPGVV